jgi:hypothetical protein
MIEQVVIIRLVRAVAENDGYEAAQQGVMLHEVGTTTEIERGLWDDGFWADLEFDIELPGPLRQKISSAYASAYLDAFKRGVAER